MKTKKTAKYLLYGGASLVLAALLVRFIGSPVATAIANKRLAALPGYNGRVGKVGLALWRGTVLVHDFRMWEQGTANSDPVLNLRRASLTVSWAPLFRGRMAGCGVVDGLDILVLDEPGPDAKPEKQLPVETKNGRSRSTRLFPWR